MKKKPKFIDYYNEWVKTGVMPDHGLCASLHESLVISKEYELIEPSNYDFDKLFLEGKSTIYWGDNKKYPTKESVRVAFNELRQNLVLLCACMRNEY